VKAALGEAGRCSVDDLPPSRLEVGFGYFRHVPGTPGGMIGRFKKRMLTLFIHQRANAGQGFTNLWLR
jgi:hypothetical protein